MYLVHYTSENKLLGTSYRGRWYAKSATDAAYNLRWTSKTHKMNKVSAKYERDYTLLYQASNDEITFTAMGFYVENDQKEHYVEEYLKL